MHIPHLISSLARSVLPTQLVKRVAAARKSPAYPGRWLIGDSDWWTTGYFNVVRRLHSTDFKQRRRVMADLLSRYSDRIPDQDGFGIFSFRDNRAYHDCVATSRAIIQATDLAKKAEEAKKKFLVVMPVDLDDPANAAITRFALDEQLIAIASAYLGSIPVLDSIQLWYSPNIEMDGRSQLFHRDGGDVRQLKCFVPIEDVDLDCGPLHAVAASTSDRLYASLAANGLTTGRNGKFQDDQVYKFISPEAVIPMTSKVGELALVDTSRCYHFGSRPASKPRLLLSFRFYSAYSTELPVYGRAQRPMHSVTAISPSEQTLHDLVTGLSHQSFTRFRFGSGSMAN